MLKYMYYLLIVQTDKNVLF